MFVALFGFEQGEMTTTRMERPPSARLSMPTPFSMAPSSVGVRGCEFELVPAFVEALALHCGRKVVNADALTNGLKWRRTRFAAPNVFRSLVDVQRDPTA